MPGLDGTGPRGMGPMTGGGRGFCSPWGLGVARPVYGFPRYHGAYGLRAFAPRLTREQELEFLKTDADALRQELKKLEDRIGQLSAEKE